MINNDLDFLRKLTLKELNNVLRDTRKEETGIPLELVAKAIKKQFTEEEIEVIKTLI